MYNNFVVLTWNQNWRFLAFSMNMSYNPVCLYDTKVSHTRVFSSQKKVLEEKLSDCSDCSDCFFLAIINPLNTPLITK